MRGVEEIKRWGNRYWKKRGPTKIGRRGSNENWEVGQQEIGRKKRKQEIGRRGSRRV